MTDSTSVNTTENVVTRSIDRASVLGLLLTQAVGCDQGAGAGDPWLELGWGEPFTRFEQGDVLEMQIGSQGARMFPVAVRTSMLALPGSKDDDGGDARLDVTLVGTDAGIPGVGLSARGVRLGLRPQEDETMLFYFVPLIPPEDADAGAFDGPGELEATLLVDGEAQAHFAVGVVLQEVSK